MSDYAQGLHIRTCPLCEAMCGIEVAVEGDRVVAHQSHPNWDLNSLLQQAPAWWIERVAKFSEADFGGA